MNQGTTTVEKKRYSIEEVAEKIGVNVWTIKLWVDRFDILMPYRDQDGNFSFSSEYIKGIEMISLLIKKDGMTLERVRKRLLSMIEKDGVSQIDTN